MTSFGVRAHELGTRFGKKIALADASFELAPNRIHGLLGRNGAGKTTLLSLVAALRQPQQGQVRVADQDPFENEYVTERVCLVRESGDVLTDESLETNLDFLQRARPTTFDRNYAEELMQAFALDPCGKPAKISRGQKSAFGVVMGLASRAPLTIFDEVHLGMDAPSRNLFYESLLADFAENPRTVILSSHLISEIETFLETVTILDQGRVILSEEAETVRTRGATLTGPAAAVEESAAGLTVVGSRDLGPTKQVTLYGDITSLPQEHLQARGLTLGPVPLQDLFIHLTSQQEKP